MQVKLSSVFRELQEKNSWEYQNPMRTEESSNDSMRIKTTEIYLTRQAE